ncbi:MAG: hypothetical protein ACRD35_07305, partial [Candidatus Acidiferrales bacterium]
YALAVYGSFAWNVSLSAVARLLLYGSGCAAVLVFRRRRATPAAFRVPAAPFLSLLGIGFCLVLLVRMSWMEFLILGLTALLAAATWLWRRGHPRAAA